MRTRLFSQHSTQRSTRGTDSRSRRAKRSPRARSRSGHLSLEALEDRRLLAHASGEALPHMDPLWAPDTPAEVVEAYEAEHGHHDEEIHGPIPPDSVLGTVRNALRESRRSPFTFAAFQFNDSDRWGETASDGGNLTQGEPTTLTWSIVPDGTSIYGYNNEPTSDSDLIAFLDGIYGAGPGGSDLTQRPWFPVIRSEFDRWSELSGVEYVYEPADDGAAWTQFFLPDGQLGVRGDVRIGGHPLDGNGGVLAYNFFPDAGEMVIDTSDKFYDNTSNNSLRLRNVIAHEAGHGLGFSHVHPVIQTKLMEPFLTTAFDGPQFDDILAAHRGYGDDNEQGNGNDTIQNPTNLGTIAINQTVTIGEDAVDVTVAPTDVDFVSIDDDGDVDFFSFTVTAAAQVDLTLMPLGPTYNSGPSSGNNSEFNAKAQSDLSLEIFASDKSTSLGFANANGLAGNEVLNDIVLAAAGEYYVKVSGAQNAAQFFQLDVSVSSGQNNPPTANDDSYLIRGDTSGHSLNVLANDTTAPDTGETLTIISASAGSAGGSVQVNQAGTAIEYAPLTGYVGTETFTYTINDGTSGSNDTATVTIDVYDPRTVNFNDYTLGGYAGSNDSTGPVTIEDGGLTLRMEGNRWKEINFSYNVTPNTVIELDFRSTNQGEIHAIGMDDDTSLSIPRNIQFYGTQTSGVQNHRDYDTAPNFKHYVIPIGQYYTGQMNHLFFVNDHDVSNPTAVSYFSNVKVYEDDQNSPPTANDDSFSVEVDSTNNTLNVLANDTAAPDTGETLTIIAASAGSAGGTVQINQTGSAILYSPKAGYTGSETFTYTINDGTQGSNDTATVTVSVQDQDFINFNDYSIGGYAGSNDSTGPVTIEDGGLTLRMEGNRWKQINFAYNVTANTVIELDFRSTAEGEIHAIGMDDDTALSIPRNIQFYGTQTSGVQNHRNYDTAPNFKHYVIPIGQYYTGQMNHLFFVNDHDVSNPTAVSYFSNIVVYEDTNNSPPTANDDSFSVAPNSSNNTLNVLANDSTEPDTGETLTIISASAGSAGGSVQINQAGTAIIYAPQPGFEGTETFTYTINDGTPGSNDTATVTVSVQDQNLLNFNDYTIGGYAGSNDQTGPVTVEDGGLTLRMEGNRWKQINFAYNVTANTVIELDFRSTAQGEIHAIGMDDDTSLSIPRNIQFYGTQTSGVQNHRNYDTAPNFKHYVIPIGQYYRGQMNHLFFVNDHDVSNPTAVSYFSNIEIYEQTSGLRFLEGATESPSQDDLASTAATGGGTTESLIENLALGQCDAVRKTSVEKAADAPIGKLDSRDDFFANFSRRPAEPQRKLEGLLELLAKKR